jgi:hypothetical protein
VLRTSIIDADRNRPAEAGAPTGRASLSDGGRDWAQRFRAEL